MSERFATIQPANSRWRDGWLLHMTTINGWVMVQYPGERPFAMTSAEWSALPHESPCRDVERDVKRIRLNLDAFMEASNDHSHHKWRADQAKAVMDRALRDLLAAGGIAEAATFAKGY